MTNILYLTVMDDLRDKIIKGVLKPGDMLKSESEMMKEYAVSRMTLRKSLSLLSNGGYIYSVPGKGYYVRMPEKDLYQFRFHGHESLACTVDAVKLLSVNIEISQGENKNLLNVPENGKIVVMERMSFCGNIPTAVEVVYFAYEKNQPVIEDKLSFANYPRILESKFGFGVKRELEVQLVEVPDRVGEKLLLKKNDLVFLVTKKVLKKDNNAVVSVNKYYIKKEYYSIKSFSPEENDSKKIL